MNKIYGGFVSNPVNKKDMTDRGDITRTFGGNIVISYSNIMPTYTAPTAKTNLEYTGEAQELVNPGSSKDGIIKYSLDNSTWSTNIPTGTAALTYTVYWKLEGNTGFEDVSSSSISVSIAAVKQLWALVFGDDQCTVPPLPGDSEVHVKLYRSFGFDEPVGWKKDGYTCFAINTPTSEYTTDPYNMMYEVDFLSQDYDEQFLSDDMILLEGGPEQIVVAGMPTKFYSDGTCDTPVEELPE